MTLSSVLQFVVLVYTALICLIKEIYRLTMLAISPAYKDLQDDVILITGAGGGLGRELALEFGHHCKALVLWDVNASLLEETVSLVRASTQISVNSYVCDLRSAQSIFDTAKRVLTEVGRVTVLINNAGMVNGKMLLDLSPDDLENCFKVNVFSHFYTVKAFLPSMLGRSYSMMEENAPTSGGDDATLHKDCQPKGHIVCISSVGGHIPCVGLTDYTASKAAALLAAESLEQELFKMNVHQQICVTRVMPFFMDTPMFAGCQSEQKWLFPTVNASACARRVLCAVRGNENVVYIWPRFRALPFIKLIFPTAVLRILYSYGGCEYFVSQLQRHRKLVKSRSDSTD